MEADLDPKFLNKFSTDYKYEELTPEQREVHDLLFADNEEILVGEEGLPDEKVELDEIISEAKGGVIQLKALSKEDEEKKRKLEEKERQALELLKAQKRAEQGMAKPAPVQSKPVAKETEMSEEKFTETAEERFIRQIIGKPVKKVKFEDMDEGRSEDEMSGDDEDGSDEDFLPPKEMPKKMDFSEEDFPHISIYNDAEPEGDDVDVEEISHHDSEDEEDKAMEAAIRKEQELENEFKEVLKNEYDGAKQERTKQLTAKEFDSIINSHLSTMDASKKKALATKGKPEKKPEVVNVVSKGGGQITFYFGGAKPDEGKSKAKKAVSQGVKKAVGPEANMAELKALMAEKAAKAGQVIVDNEEDGEEEWDEQEVEEQEIDGEEEEEDDDGEEEESDDEGLDPQEKYEKMLNKMQLLENLPLCMRIERDAKLPDTIMGLKVFKKVLTEPVKYKHDYAAQRVTEEEEEIDFSKPPPGFDKPSIRGGALVESQYEPKVATKEEAMGKATVVREKNSKKKKAYKPKKSKAKAEPEAQEEEEESEDKGIDLTVPKNETEEEKKARKALVKQLKAERKQKKQKFKEKYEQMKKGFLTQNRAQTDGTQGVPVYRIT